MKLRVCSLADLSAFGLEGGSQVAPLKTVHKLIMDNSLPADFRLSIAKAGIQIILA